MMNIRSQFPQIANDPQGTVYLDSAATTLKPQVVIDAITRHYSRGVANVHRGAYRWSDEATQNFENSRHTIARFIGARPEETIFTRGTTESINLVASALGSSLREGDEILLTQMEHHSNIVPWQLLAERKGLKIKFIPVDAQGNLDLRRLPDLLGERTRILSVVYISNALGTVNPVKDLIAAAHSVGAHVLLDAAQAVSALPIQVRELDCDFLAFSGHKLFGPTGIGVLYGKTEVLDKMPPYQGGGSMITHVFESHSEYLASPHRFEAGTPAIGEAIALATAVEFVEGLTFHAIRAHEKELLERTEEMITRIPQVKVLSRGHSRANILSFNLGDAHPSDVAAILNQQNIAVRAGHHCCQPLMRTLNVPGTVRASFSIYNNLSDVEALMNGLKKAVELLL